MHTRGPWIFIDATKVAGMQFAPKFVIKSGPKEIASFSWNDNSPWFPNKSESEANARLTVASLDLLKALRPLAALEVPQKPTGNAGAYSIRHVDIENAKAAIAKAEGL